jgi:hypothetical protein
MGGLYLRGFGNGAMRGLRSSFGVEAALRREGKGLGQAAETLRRAGFRAEAATLEIPGLIARAEELRGLGRFLVRGDALYPMGWERYMGEAAPAAIWCSGGSAVVRALRRRLENGWRVRSATIVGMRRTSEFAGVFEAAVLAGASAARAGRVVLSGGARGCDRAAVAGALEYFGNCGALGDVSDLGTGAPFGPAADEIRAIEVVAMGLSYHVREVLGGRRAFPDASGDSAAYGADGVGGAFGAGRAYEAGGADCASNGSGAEIVRLSLCPPEMGFSTAAAMERNALLYAGGEASLVVASNFRTGGTWVGATSALRQRFGQVYVLDPASLDGRGGMGSVDSAHSFGAADSFDSADSFESMVSAVSVVSVDSARKEGRSISVGAEPELSRAASALWALGAGRISHPQLFGELWNRTPALSVVRSRSRAEDRARELLARTVADGGSEALGEAMRDGMPSRRDGPIGSGVGAAPGRQFGRRGCDPPGFASPLRELPLFDEQDGAA